MPGRERGKFIAGKGQPEGRRRACPRRFILLLLAAALFAAGCLWTLLPAGSERPEQRQDFGALPRRDAEAPEKEIYAIELDSEEDAAQRAGEVSWYFYNHLSEEDRELYEDIYTGIMNMDEKIALSTSDYDTVYEMETLIICDHPEIFWYTGEGTVMQSAFRVTLVPNYTVTAEERAHREEQIAKMTDAYLARIGPGETDYEKLATAFKFLAGWVTYEMGAPDDQNICSSLINGRSVCAGYARGLQYLLQQVGIECLYVFGTVEGRGDHAWNIVNLNGTYVHSDITFGDRSYEEGQDVVLPDALAVEYGYMCMDDASALRDRTVDAPERVSLPVCDSTEYSYYHRHGWYFPEYTEQVWSDIRADLQDGSRCFHFQFGSRDAYEKFREELLDNRFSKIALQELGLSRIRTYMLPNDTLYVMSGWIP